MTDHRLSPLSPRGHTLPESEESYDYRASRRKVEREWLRNAQTRTAIDVAGMCVLGEKQK